MQPAEENHENWSTVTDICHFRANFSERGSLSRSGSGGTTGFGLSDAVPASEPAAGHIPALRFGLPYSGQHEPMPPPYQGIQQVVRTGANGGGCIRADKKNVQLDDLPGKAWRPTLYGEQL